MATINASGIIGSVVDESNFNYTITLTNSSTSTAGIGTFWYAWTPVRTGLSGHKSSLRYSARRWSEMITHSRLVRRLRH